MNVPWQEFKPFHLAVFRGPYITCWKLFQLKSFFFHYFLGSVLLFQCCVGIFSPVWETRIFFIVSR